LSSAEHHGRVVVIAKHKGDALTFLVLNLLTPIEAATGHQPDILAFMDLTGISQSIRKHILPPLFILLLLNILVAWYILLHKGMHLHFWFLIPSETKWSLGLSFALLRLALHQISLLKSLVTSHQMVGSLVGFYRLRLRVFVENHKCNL
jgi:hypothetical protein